MQRDRWGCLSCLSQGTAGPQGEAMGGWAAVRSLRRVDEGETGSDNGVVPFDDEKTGRPGGWVSGSGERRLSLTPCDGCL